MQIASLRSLWQPSLGLSIVGGALGYLEARHWRRGCCWVGRQRRGDGWVGIPEEISEAAMHGVNMAAGSLAKKVCQYLREQRREVWLVGGYIRDQELGRETHDLDVIVSDNAIRLARRLADHFGGAFFPLDAERDVGRALLPQAGQDLVVDISRTRGSELVTDLSQRDFTINAMACDLASDTPTLIDFHGGREDLKAGLIRAVSSEAFRDDPVRTLRAVRLAAELDFELEAQTAVWTRRDASLLREISLERVQHELVRILDSPGGPDHLRMLDDLGLLGIVLPEVVDLQGVRQSPPHYLTVYEHSLETLGQAVRLLGSLGGERAEESVRSGVDLALGQGRDGLSSFSADLRNHLSERTSAERTRGTMLRWAALLHDLGKPKTRSVEVDGRVRFLRHESVGGELATQVLRRLRFTGGEADWVGTIVRQHLRPSQLAREPVLTRRAVFRFFRDAGAAGVDTCILSLADHLATWGPNLIADRWSRRVATTVRLLDTFFTRHKDVVAPQPLLGGRDLQYLFGVAEGPRIGLLLEALREAQAVDEVRTRDEAEAFVYRLLQANEDGQGE